ncbi:MAG: AMMECR1 family protein [Desulfuromonadales bacterium]|nr:AMMECR1 family protein [Desulfuromonadales bacterium]
MKFKNLIFIAVIFSLCWTSPVKSSTLYNKIETVALLNYARYCMLANINNTTPPKAPEFALKEQRPCFVTFFQGKRVFACFGSFSPRKSNLAEEIRENIRLALLNDPRARNVSYEMAKTAGIQITFPEHLRAVQNYNEINPAREGMFIESDNSGVAFVPGEAKTASWAFRQGLRRLGEKDPKAVRIYKFDATAISTRQ